MPWFKTTDTLMTDAKVMMMPLNERGMALGTWIACGTWSTQHLTDGKVPAPIVEAFVGTISGAETLVEARMWKRIRGGFQFNNWPKYQFTREQIETKRDEDRERKAQWRATKDKKSQVKGGNVTDMSQRDTAGTSAESALTRPVPTRPVPSRPLKETGQVGGGKSPKQDTGNNAPDIQPCGKAHDPDDACRACGTARKQAEADQIKAKRDQRSTEAKKRARVAHAAITACNFCNAKGYTPGGKPCRHDLDDEVDS